MSIFDKLKSTAGQAVNAAAQSLGSKRETFTFAALPESHTLQNGGTYGSRSVCVCGR